MLRLVAALGPVSAAAPTGGPDAAFEGVIWLAGIVAVVMMSTVVLVAVRRRIEPGGASSTGSPFTLEELRKMRADGGLSPAEFDRLKLRAIELSRGNGAVSSTAGAMNRASSVPERATGR